MRAAIPCSKNGAASNAVAAVAGEPLPVRAPLTKTAPVRRAATAGVVARAVRRAAVGINGTATVAGALGFSKLVSAASATV